MDRERERERERLKRSKRKLAEVVYMDQRAISVIDFTIFFFFKLKTRQSNITRLRACSYGAS